MKIQKKIIYLAIAIMLVFGLLLGACQPTTAPTEAPSAEEPAAEEPVAEEPAEEPMEEAPAAEEPAPETGEVAVVRVGNTPFFDYQFWSVSKPLRIILPEP